MKTIFNRNVWSILLLSILITAGSCVKEDFDTVPPVTYSGLTATTTVKQLRTLYGSSTTTGLKKISALYSQSFYNDLKERGLDTTLVIKGVVVSSDSAGAFYKSVWIEDGTGGIEVLVEAKDMFSAYAFKPGWPVILKVSNLYAMRSSSSYDVQLGTPEVDNTLSRIDASNINDFVELSGLRGAENPLTVKLTDLNDSLKGRLIRLDGVEFLVTDTAKIFVDGTATTNRTLKDCDGNTIVLRTSGYSTFGALSLPNLNGSAVGVLTKFGASTYQLVVRSEKDFQFVNDRCVEPAVVFSESFTSVVKYADITLSGWTNFAEAGTKKWRGNVYNSDSYAEMTPFGSGEVSNIAWLITPGVDLPSTGVSALKFISEYHHWVDGATLEVFVSTDFSGTVGSATWIKIPARVPILSDGQFIWVNSGSVDLSAYAGQKIYVAFKYSGSGTSSTGFNIDNVIISNK
ncbi:DUF5689 domain-containing protein [Williamwhitmania taraxaci]|uniref:DUF5689 domain-containing protein n=1 Tax=Williamwhitmania taraxaci TaxID=1640674 RepID=A0A1G6RXB7_9BACT|nr:DUF5689 domain-containing protein [Williamwhitmania taraxaci]SDD08607.1 protein of unknown function [Williamwhitmania taraxaci]